MDEGGGIQDIALKKCPWYYVLESVMVDRPGTDPLELFEVGLLDEDKQSYAENHVDGSADGDADC